MAKYSDLVFRYMRIDHLPQIWCPGCGNGILMRDVVVAIDNLKLVREKVVIVSVLPILACTSLIPSLISG